ncbi:ankyrin repeat domain-containing protein [Legionella drancourtii]|uniref:ankyrin repeat domain-containing protein n=1 Tax=Legionella drancourtii TaxID=168933 RepID=UPI00058D669A|nr:ankyrin repeat domain-containing protein [Legionella drancourtii]
MLSTKTPNVIARVPVNEFIAFVNKMYPSFSEKIKLPTLTTLFQGKRELSLDDKLFNLCLIPLNTDWNRVNELLSTPGINIDKRLLSGNTCLIRAVRMRNKELVLLLLKHNADREIKNDRNKNASDEATGEIKELIDSWDYSEELSAQIESSIRIGSCK